MTLCLPRSSENQVGEGPLLWAFGRQLREGASLNTEIPRDSQTLSIVAAVCIGLYFPGVITDDLIFCTPQAGVSLDSVYHQQKFPGNSS